MEWTRPIRDLQNAPSVYEKGLQTRGNSRANKV